MQQMRGIHFALNAKAYSKAEGNTTHPAIMFLDISALFARVASIQSFV